MPEQVETIPVEPESAASALPSKVLPSSSPNPALAPAPQALSSGMEASQSATDVLSYVPDPVATDSLAIKIALWTAIAVYIIAFAWWGFNAGMQLRQDAWVNSRTIRFNGDIANGMHWGGVVLQTAERTANSTAGNDPKSPQLIARAAPQSANERPLTFWELYHGVDQVYQDMVSRLSTDGEFQLDYPPLRLLSMSLWTRHVAQQIHQIPNWPQGWHLNYDDHGDPAAIYTEDIAQPVLMANAYSIVASAVCGFFLVWIWVNRGGRPALPQPRTGWQAWVLPRRRLIPWKPVSLRNINGLAVFAISAAAFFYALVVAESPVPMPPPAVTIVGRPYLAIKDGKINATLTASIDGQGNDAQWYVEWGKGPLYGHQSKTQNAGDEDSSVVLTNLPAQTTIHYRIAARNDPGLTRTNDETFTTPAASDISVPIAPAPDHFTYGAAWLNWRQWIGVAILFFAMACSLRFLPPVHRGWAAGLAAAMFMWIDPSILMDGHVWPQWDAWVLPPFFLAALLATVDWWFLAGIVLGVGINFKGQTMIGGTILILWPLVAMQWGALTRIGCGIALGAGAVLAPWLVLNNAPAQWSVGPMRWVPCVMAAAFIALALSFYRRPVWLRALAVWDELKDEWNGTTPDPAAPGKPRPQTSLLELIIFCASLLAGIVAVTILLLRRWPSDAELPRISGLFLLLAVLIPPWFLPRRATLIWLGAILASTIWMSAFLYHGDWTWKSVGFEYGARKHTDMALGQGGMGNLPQILQTRFQWDIGDTALAFHPPDIATPFHLGKRAPDGSITGPIHDWGLDGSLVTLDIRQFLALLYFALALLAGAGAAIQARRNDPRLLASFAAVWTLLPNILCQMAARYQMWGAIVSSMLIALSPGLGLLHILCAILAAGMVAAQLLNYDPSRSPLLRDLMSHFHPDDGWIMLIIGAVFLYTALAAGRRPSPSELSDQ